MKEYSINNRVIVEQYIKEGLKAKITGGIATPGQRDGLKGLKVLVTARLSDGTIIPKDSLVYVKEEALHSHPWAVKPLTCDKIPVKFMILESSYIEFIESDFE